MQPNASEAVDVLDQRLLDELPDAVIAGDAARRLVYANRAAVVLLGRPLGQLIGRDLASILPDLDLHATPGQRRTRIATAAGGRQVDVHLAVRAAGGVIMTLRQLSDLAERRLGAQLAVMKVLLGARSVDECAGAVLEAIGNSLRWDFGAYWVVDAAGERLISRVSWHDPELPEAMAAALTAVRELPVEGSLVGAVSRDGAPTWVADLARDPRYRRAGLPGAERVRGAYYLPVQQGGRVTAVLEFLAATADPPDAELLSNMQAIASFIGQCAERARAEEELRISRGWFETTLRSIGDAVIATDTEARVTFMNPVAEDCTGFTLAQALGQPLAQVFRTRDEGTRSERESPATRVLREGATVSLEPHTLLVRKDGRELPIDDSSAPILSDSGELAGVVVVFRNIEGRRREEEAQSYLARATTLLASSLDWRHTLPQLARMLVPRFADWCSIDVLEGGHIRSLAVAHSDPHKLQLAMQLREEFPIDPHSPRGVARVIRTGQPELVPEIPPDLIDTGSLGAHHRELLRALGLRSYLAVPLMAEGGAFGAITLVASTPGRRFDQHDLMLATEVARRASTAVEHARLYNEAQDASRAKDEFLATVSHELRTPLNAILGWARLLKLGQVDDANVPRAIDTIERNATTQARLIEDLLEVSRIISGKLRLELHPVDASRAVEAAVDTVRPAAEAKAIELRLEVAPVRGSVLGDAPRLQQIVWNLVSNAIKFTPQGGRVDVRLTPLDGQVEIAVSDTGRGIEPDFLPHVFERFRQADSSSRRSFGGLGLGLAIARHLVELHGGTIHAESPGVGQGATFRVLLPLVALRPGRATGPERRRRPPPVTGQQLALRSVRVLLVDDEPDARMLLTAVLEQHGAKVYALPSAEAALAALESVRPHVILSDIEMPGMDGYDLIARIRARDEKQGGRIPAAALTAHARSEDRAQAMLAGYQVHIAKPVDPVELAAVVANLAGRPPPAETRPEP